LQGWLGWECGRASTSNVQHPTSNIQGWGAWVDHAGVGWRGRLGCCAGGPCGVRGAEGFSHEGAKAQRRRDGDRSAREVRAAVNIQHPTLPAPPGAVAALRRAHPAGPAGAGAMSLRSILRAGLRAGYLSRNCGTIYASLRFAPLGSTSNVQHPTSNIQHPTSNIQHPTSNIQGWGAWVCHAAFGWRGVLQPQMRLQDDPLFLHNEPARSCERGYGSARRSRPRKSGDLRHIDLAPRGRYLR
jgi:hypothetical protein